MAFDREFPWWVVCVVLCLLPAAIAVGADSPQWGERFSRNMISPETGLPATIDPADTRGVKWTARLGTETWSTPVIAAGKVLIGTNNEEPRDARNKGDRGVLMCFNDADGSFCWQLTAAKLADDIYKDWPRVGMVSPATVEGGLVYMVTNRGEIVCLDLDGMSDGNDGPYRDEGRHMVPAQDKPLEPTGTDADIVWLFDVPAEVGVFPHDGAHGSILIHGQFLYVNTSSGLHGSHKAVRVPDAPSLIVLDKTTGQLVAQEREGIGHKIFHSTWSSPALGEVNGRTLVFFCGGDGVCYAFEPVTAVPAKGTVEKLKLLWRFDCDPTAPKENIHDYIRNRQVSPSNIKSMPVFYRNRLYVTVGGDIWWGKEQAWLQCIDATGSGDITKTGLLWSYPVKEHCCSTPAIWNGLAFVADCGGYVHCVDAETGKPYWSHNCEGEIWASTLAADGKIYVGTRRGQLWVFAADKEEQVLCSVRLDSPMAGSPVAANGTLYVTTMKTLYAFRTPAP
jgi:outer membrane protein assembly factor BamB